MSIQRCVCIYIYIYIERERERERDTEIDIYSNIIYNHPKLETTQNGSINHGTSSHWNIINQNK